jgi:HEAT repeat protein
MEIPEAIAALSSPDESARHEAAYALERIARSKSASLEHAVPALIECIENPDSELRRTAIWTLAEIGRPAAAAVPRLQAQIDRETDLSCHCAEACALAKIGHSEAISELIKYLDDPPWDPTFPGFVCDTLAELGPLASSAVPHLRRRWEANIAGDELHSDAYWDDTLATALRAIPGPEAIPLFASGLTHRTLRIRWQAAFALSDYGDLTEQEILRLIEVFESVADDELASRAATVQHEMLSRRDAWAAGSFNFSGPIGMDKPDNPVALPLLDAALDIEEPEARGSGIRGEAVRRIRYIGTPASRLSRRLIELSAVKDEVANLVILAFGKIGAEAVPVLIEALRSRNPAVRHTALWSVAEIGRVAGPAVPAVMALAKDKNKDVRNSALWTLSKIVGPADAAAAPLLIEGLSQPVWSTRERQQFFDSLAEMARSTRTVLSALKKLTRNRDPEIRAFAEKAVEEVQ